MHLKVHLYPGYVTSLICSGHEKDSKRLVPLSKRTVNLDIFMMQGIKFVGNSIVHFRKICLHEVFVYLERIVHVIFDTFTQNTNINI